MRVTVPQEWLCRKIAASGAMCGGMADSPRRPSFTQSIRLLACRRDLNPDRSLATHHHRSTMCYRRLSAQILFPAGSRR